MGTQIWIEPGLAVLAISPLRLVTMAPGLAKRLAGRGLAVAVALVFSCSARRGPLTPPVDARPWDSRFAVAFDDGYTPEGLELWGRASHDVLDQRRFAQRMGHADLIAVVKVDQVWARGRYEGRPDQYLDVILGEALMGRVARRTDERQLLRVLGPDLLPAALQDRQLLLFVRWAPDTRAGYHHHLVPADPDLVAYVRAMVAHAKSKGALKRVPSR